MYPNVEAEKARTKTTLAIMANAYMDFISEVTSGKN